MSADGTASRVVMVVLVVLLAVGFLFLNVAVFQVVREIGKTREMVVWKKGVTLPGDRAKWSVDLERILAVARLFGARLIHNFPEYYECYLGVPALSYDVLSRVLGLMGYETSEPVLLTALG